MKYMKKQVVIEAIQWTGTNKAEISSFCPAIFDNGINLKIETLEGVMSASIGDYIIKGIKGEFYPCKEDIFQESYDKLQVVDVNDKSWTEMPVKSLHNTTSNGARKNVKDIQFWGDGDMFKLISKASSESEGWMKSTKAMQINGAGCVVQVTTQRRNPDGSYSLSDAVTFVPNAVIEASFENAEVVSRKLVVIQ